MHLLFQFGFHGSDRLPDESLLREELPVYGMFIARHFEKQLVIRSAPLLGGIINMCIDAAGLVITDPVHLKSGHRFYIIINYSFINSIWIVGTRLGIKSKYPESGIGRVQINSGTEQWHNARTCLLQGQKQGSVHKNFCFGHILKDSGTPEEHYLLRVIRITSD